MNELQNFTFDGSTIRTITINDEPYFVGKDVCRLFGDKNHNRSIGRVDEIDKRCEEITDSIGRKQKAIFVNESGLYALLFAMQPQKAHHDGVSDEYPIEIQERIDRLHRFKRWVTSEVLPAIRKHGVYATEELLNNPDLAIKAFQALKEEREKRRALETKTKLLEQQLEETKPKVSYYDLILNCKDVVSITKIAKDFGKSGQWLNIYLADKKVQYKQGKIWLLYSKYQSEGYTQTKTTPYAGSDGEAHVSVSTYWTQKGRLFIYNLLKADGFLPLIEKGGA